MPRVRGQSAARGGRGRGSRGRGRTPAAATSAATSGQGANRRLPFSAEPAPVTHDAPTPSTSRKTSKILDISKQSPERKLPRLMMPGTPSGPPLPKPQPWQLQQPTSRVARETARETTPLRTNSPVVGTPTSHVTYDCKVEAPSPLRVDWSSGNLVEPVEPQTSVPWRWCRSPSPGPSDSAPLASSHCGLYEDANAHLDAWQSQLDEASDASDGDADDGPSVAQSDQDPINYSRMEFAAQEDLDPELQSWLARNDARSDSHLRRMVPTDYLTFNWNNDVNSFRGQREKFTGCSGPTFEVDKNTRPLDIFKRFFTDELLDLIVHETNRYANQVISKSHTPSSRLSRWTPTDRGEIAVFLAVIMFQGAAPLTCEIDYFRENGYLTFKYFNTLMTYDRYRLLTRLLHFSDNEDIPTDITTDEKKLRKINPVLKYLNNKYSTLYLPSQNIAIDESLMKWHGPLGFAQKIARKAAKVGIKSYELCESSTGYLWSFYIYTGKQTDQQTDGLSDEPTRPTDGTIDEPTRQTDEPTRQTDESSRQTDEPTRQTDEPTRQTDEPTRQTDELRPPPPTGATAKIVNELAGPLFRRGHTLVMDNFFNSPLLARYLKSQGTDCFGTLRVNREFVPEGLKLINKSDLRTGELIQTYSHDLSIVMWRDNNLVSLISTYHRGQVGGKEKYGTYKYKPQVVLDYNNAMGGVDRKDQLLSAHPMERSRGHSWYKKLFRHILNTTILNSLIIFKTQNPKITQRDFRRQLAESLVETYRPKRRIVDIEELPKVYDQQRPVLRGNHYADYGLSKHKVCTECRKSRTKFICKQCKVSLCIIKCFEAYHSG